MTRRNFAVMDDLTLLDAEVTWRDDALQELYRRHVDSVRALARRILFDREAAEEVVQELFLRLWTTPTRFDASRGSLRQFLLIECRGRCRDRMRADTARRRREESRVRQEGHVAERTSGIEDIIASRWDVDALLRRLLDHERRPIVLAFLQGYSYVEVAAILQEPEGTIKTRIRRGLRRLRQEILAGSDEQEASDRALAKATG